MLRSEPEFPDSPSTTGEGLVLGDAGPKGLGVFAARPFLAGEEVLRFGGPLLETGRISDFTHTIQVDEGLFLGPSGSFDDFVNHSCDPNCALRSASRDLRLEALRTIQVGEEVTFDYSTCLLEEPPLDSCWCGSPACRGGVVRFWDLDRATHRSYRALRAVPGFVLRGRRRSLDARAGAKYSPARTARASIP